MEKNDFYESVNISDIYENVSKNKIVIEDNVIKYIRSKFYNFTKIDEDGKQISIRLYHIDLYIFQCPDEWFYIQKVWTRGGQDREFYKCDQLDGLIEFLKDKL